MPSGSNLPFAGTAQPLAPGDIRAALVALGLHPTADQALLWAVLAVESRGFGFLADRRPQILFERHIFFGETHGRFAATAPDLCARTGGGYAGGTAEYARLDRALDLCRRAGLGDEPALRSASWGLGQVMGFNAALAGFGTAAEMAIQMAAGEGAQLAAMACFLRSQRLERYLKAQDWAGFACRYNGSNYWRNEYDVKLKLAHAQFASGFSRDLRARAAQAALLFLGYRPGNPDGIVGQNTRRAIVDFRANAGMGSAPELDDQVFRAILAKAGLTWAD